MMLVMPAMLAMRVFAACYSCVFKCDDFASVGFVNVIEDQFLTGPTRISCKMKLPLHDSSKPCGVRVADAVWAKCLQTGLLRHRGPQTQLFWTPHRTRRGSREGVTWACLPDGLSGAPNCGGMALPADEASDATCVWPMAHLFHFDSAQAESAFVLTNPEQKRSLRCRRLFNPPSLSQANTPNSSDSQIP